jgi:hypothetical protein
MEESGKHYTLAALYTQGNDPQYPLDKKAGWASELIWTWRLRQKSFASARN